ncbi:MAG: hypothetical protein R2747_22955 [Pyrinomonadaceae bacterium]
MEQFNRIGAQLEKLWRDKNYAEDEFPALAAGILAEAALPEKISAWDVIGWTLGQTQLPEQKDLKANFGDPPITLYNSPRFHIDVYFWLEGTTAIHQHAFCGAFQVLHGSSIHSWYEFELLNKINAFTEVGRISLKLCELLEVGDTQQILAGRQYIHGLFHLDQPSATIVVRTHKSPLYLPQYSYHKPFLAIDPFFEEANTIKKIQCLTALFRSNHPDTDKFIGELLEGSDFQTTFSILSTVRHYLGQNQLDRLFNLSGATDRFDAFLEIARRRHGEPADIFPAVFAWQETIEEIVKRRSYVSEPEHRFFLALLMNVEGRDRIFSLIRERFPEADPLEKVLDWVFDLSQTRVLGLNVPNALGIAGFGDLDLFILECLLKGIPEGELPAALRAEYPAEPADALEADLSQKLATIRQTAIFRPLLI